MSEKGRNRTASDNNGPKLEIVRHPPTHVLADKWENFDIRLSEWSEKVLPQSSNLSNNNETVEEGVEPLNEGKSDFINVRIEINRVGESSHVQGTTNAEKSLPILKTDPPSPIRISCHEAKSITKINFKITQISQSPSFIGPEFCITLHLEKTREKSTDIQKSITMRTRPFQIALNTLAIHAESWDDIWYKDEGGREKCMQVSVSLRDKDNNLITNRRIPLKYTLLYQNDEYLQVMRQEILHVFGPPKRELNEKTGSSVFRFRIEDVSKNHQGQNFVVKAEQDSPQYTGIAPAYTPSVSIRSKRNKRQRATSTSLKYEGSTNNSNSNSNNFMQQRLSESHMKNASGIPLSSSPFSLDGADLDRGSSPIGFRGYGERDIQRLRDAMRGVIKWTEEVVNGLYPLQWQVVGYSPNPDGSFDYNRPYHTMPNPNACISRILSMYSESTREHLRILISAVEHTRSIPGPGPDPDLDIRRRTHTASISDRAPINQDANTTAMTSSQRRRSPPNHALHEEPKPTNSPPYDNHHNPMTNSYNSYKQESYSAFSPPWTDRYSPKRSPHPHGSSYMTNPTPIHNPHPLPLHTHTHPRTHAHPPHDHMMNYTSPPPPSSSTSQPPPPSSSTSSHAVNTTGSPNSANNNPSNTNSTPTNMVNTNPVRMRRNPTAASPLLGPGGSSHPDDLDMDDRQAEVAFVLATEFVSMRSGTKFGFPAFTKTKELIGFYKESKVKTGSATFTPSSRLLFEIGPMEMSQATDMLNKYIARKSEAVHAIEDWGTVRNLVDHAMVYDWNHNSVSLTEGKDLEDNSPIEYL